MIDLALRATPLAIMRLAGLTPDPWQKRTLMSRHKKKIFCTTRQCGKSTITAIEHLWIALNNPNYISQILSPTQDQSDMQLARIRELNDLCGSPIKLEKDNVHTLKFSNGHVIMSLPNNPRRIRGYSLVKGSVIYLHIDEASQVEDELILTAMPSLSTTDGDIRMTSTPFGKMGFYYDVYSNPEGWEVYKVTADDCPRHTKPFLESQKQLLGERWFQQEYYCNFLDPIDSIFPDSLIQRVFNNDLKGLRFPSLGQGKT